MAISTEPKRRIPGESTTNPQSFASPEIQTAPDVAVSQRVAGIPIEGRSATPNASQPPAQATPTTPKAATPAAGPETSNYQPQTSQPTVPTSTGAPPGVPNTTPVPAAPPAVAPVLPPTAKSVEGLGRQQREEGIAENAKNNALYEAAMKYNGGPDSEVEKDRLEAENALRGATNARGAAGTINSSLFGGDKNRIATAQATANTRAYSNYQHAINEANQNYEKARATWEAMTEQERRETAEALARKQTEEFQFAKQAPPTTVPAGAAIPGVPNPTPPGPAPPGMEWTPSGGGGWVPKGTKVVRAY